MVGWALPKTAHKGLICENFLDEMIGLYPHSYPQNPLPAGLPGSYAEEKKGSVRGRMNGCFGQGVLGIVAPEFHPQWESR